MNNQLWDEFISGKTVVNCRTENQAKKFLRICKGKGIGCMPDTSIWHDYIENTCFDCAFNAMSYATAKYYKNDFGFKVITFKQLMKDKPKEFIPDGKQHKGWEILKMIDEGKLKDEDEVIGKDDVLTSIADFQNEDIVVIKALEPFIIRTPEKHYLTFDEARKTGKEFKHKEWRKFYSLSDVLKMLSQLHPANNLMDERAWEVES